MNDREAVVAANRTFYDAFESLDVGKMESVWLQDQRIVCIHPGWRKLLGWGAIMQETLTQRGYEGISRSQVLTTNVFERSGQRWLMVVHNGSPNIQAQDDEPPLQ